MDSALKIEYQANGVYFECRGVYGMKKAIHESQHIRAMTILFYPYYADSYLGKAKSGSTNNHKRVWKELQGTKGKTYNYYPRGRVDISNKGEANIFVNPNIDLNKWLPKIKREFGIAGNNYRVIVDGSEHYKCYLDEDWKADKS